MSWFKVDDGFHSHPKVLALPLEAIGLWTKCGAYCAAYPKLEGLVTLAVASTMSGLGAAKTRALAKQLVEAGLWQELESGWRFHDWLDFNPSAEDVEDRREKRAEAGRRGGLRSGESRRSAAMPGSKEQKRLANAQLTLAIKRGDVVPQPCEVCGAAKSDGHHPDYEKPLEVVWLCERHHADEHVLLRQRSNLLHSEKQIASAAAKPGSTPSRPVPSRPDPEEERSPLPPAVDSNPEWGLEPERASAVQPIADEPADAPPAAGVTPRQLEYQRAYESGIAAGKGAPYAMPEPQRAELHRAIATFAKDRAGKAYRGDVVLRWIAHTAREFAQQVRGREATYYSSFGPRGFVKWLNEAEVDDGAEAGHGG